MKEYKLILLVSLLSIFRLASATLPDFETISHKSSDMKEYLYLNYSNKLILFSCQDYWV